MIFTACHPSLYPKDRISFALKTVSGFSYKEIATSLVTKEEIIKISCVVREKLFNMKRSFLKCPKARNFPTDLKPFWRYSNSFLTKAFIQTGRIY
ncbi:MAG: RNA polymerase sigma-70 factor (ECF subfamily) [Dokdonia sp.]|jgi:RNA polymerase sigma-70 factor (ECF subfamily)